MNAARWITARETRKSWWSALTNWREEKKSTNNEPAAMPVAVPLVLIGTFAQPEQFDRAVVAFRANHFRPHEVELVTISPAAPRTWRERLRDVFNRIRGREHCVRATVRACAGVVIVRSAACFGRACQIIEQCGGSFGFPSATPS